MWTPLKCGHIYNQDNLLGPKVPRIDILNCIVLYCRKVTSESTTGSSSSERVRTTLTLSIENIEYDTSACTIRVKGRNIQENQYVKLGAYHTIDLALNQRFRLFKDKWDSIALDRLGT